jgi:hypothetical protein
MNIWIELSVLFLKWRPRICNRCREAETREYAAIVPEFNGITMVEKNS